VRLEIFCGMIFVNLDPSATPLRSEFGFLEAEIRSFVPHIDRLKHVFDLPKRHHANWKASVENFSECYHCAPVHSWLVSNVIDPKTYRLTVRHRTQRHYIQTHDRNHDQNLWFLWPNTAFGLYPIPDFGEAFCIRHMYPVGLDETIYHYRWFADVDADPAAVIAYAKHHSTTTGDEDAAVAGGVQRGMYSLGFAEGLLLADPENGSTTEHAIAHFHGWVRRAMQEG
jgi:phenylpropionate dioxygenase-like ring-hydroxylating dioxygenase large terminal subunit